MNPAVTVGLTEQAGSAAPNDLLGLGNIAFPQLQNFSGGVTSRDLTMPVLPASSIAEVAGLDDEDCYWVGQQAAKGAWSPRLLGGGQKTGQEGCAIDDFVSNEEVGSSFTGDDGMDSSLTIDDMNGFGL